MTGGDWLTAVLNGSVISGSFLCHQRFAKAMAESKSQMEKVDETCVVRMFTVDVQGSILLNIVNPCKYDHLSMST